MAAVKPVEIAIPEQPVQRPVEGAETINLDEFYSSMEQMPPVAMGTQPPPPPAGEWTPAERPEQRSERAERPERPIVRPQATSAPLTRRAQVQSPRPGDELGVEESEFDKPAYLRRGLYAPE